MKTTITTLFTLTLVFVSLRSLTYSSGPPAALTAAPGEGTCSQCHGTGTDVTSGTVWNGMTLSVTGGSLSSLVRNTTYTMNLTFADPNSIKYGFELCVLQTGATTSTASLGTLISPSGNTQLVTSGNRTYIEHTSSGTSAPSNTLTWTFQWQAPPTYTGGARFYVVVNSTDNDGNPSPGDVIYSKSFAATVVLPVSWMYTRAETDKEGVTINWATGSEDNNWKFEVEKSSDQKDWKTIGEVKGMGNSVLVNKYSFLDANMNGSTAYYRVKQLDYNGKYSYSQIVSANTDDAAIQAPVVGYDEAQLGYVVRGKAINTIRVTNLQGETVFVSSDCADEQLIPAMGAGVYLVQIGTASNTYYQKVIMR
jgi:hypothetical protein